MKDQIILLWRQKKFPKNLASTNSAWKAKFITKKEYHKPNLTFKHYNCIKPYQIQ